MSVEVPTGGRSDRLPPYAEEAERAVLGSVLIDQDGGGRDALLSMLRGGMGCNEKWFYVPHHKVLWNGMCAMADGGKLVDLLTFPRWLRDSGLLEQAGGEAYIDALADAGRVDRHNVVAYAETVRKKFDLRRVIEQARETLDACYYGLEDPFEIGSKAMAGLSDIVNDSMPTKRSNADVFADKMANWKRAFDMRSGGLAYLPGLEMPFRRMNELLGGRQPGLHLYGGKSSAGKTTFVLNEVLHFLKNQKPVLIIQLDDTHDDVIGRMVSMLSNVSLPMLEQGFGKHDNLVKVVEQADFVSRMPLFVEEECKDAATMGAMARYYKAKHNIAAVIVDYVQVLDADGNPYDDERIRLGKLATAGKRLWKELRIPVSYVSQVSKFKDHEDDGLTADMSDLFGASELYHAASSVTIVKHVRMRADRLAKVYQNAGLSEMAEEVEKKAVKGTELLAVEMPIDKVGHTRKQAACAHVVKNKHGAKGVCRLWALLRYFQFHETRWRHELGAERQQYWDEDIADAAASIASGYGEG